MLGASRILGSLLLQSTFLLDLDLHLLRQRVSRPKGLHTEHMSAFTKCAKHNDSVGSCEKFFGCCIPVQLGSGSIQSSMQGDQSQVALLIETGSDSCSVA